MRAAIPAVDAAVVVCEADERKLPQLQIILRELEDLGIPRFLFLNKIDRANKRIQIFSPDGDFLGQWTGMGGPNDISRGQDGNFYIAEQEDGGNPAYVTVRDGQGAVLAKMESRHVHGVGVDSRGDIYAGLTQDRGVDKFVRTG